MIRCTIFSDDIIYWIFHVSLCLNSFVRDFGGISAGIFLLKKYLDIHCQIIVKA